MRVTLTPSQSVNVETALRRDVDDRTRDVIRLIGSEATKRLRSPSTSQVGVRSGRMRRGFKFSQASGRVDIINTARSKRGFPYPTIVEERTGGVARTLRAQRRSITSDAQRRLKSSQLSRGRMINEL